MGPKGRPAGFGWLSKGDDRSRIPVGRLSSCGHAAGFGDRRRTAAIAAACGYGWPMPCRRGLVRECPEAALALGASVFALMRPESTLRVPTAPPMRARSSPSQTGAPTGGPPASLTARGWRPSAALRRPPPHGPLMACVAGGARRPTPSPRRRCCRRQCRPTSCPPLTLASRRGAARGPPPSRLSVLGPRGGRLAATAPLATRLGRASARAGFAA